MRKIFRQFVLIVLVSSSVCFAQTGGNAPSAAQSSTGSASTGTSSAGGTNPEGREFGNYRVQQSVEFGYRFTEINGNPDVYDTFINQHTGSVSQT